MILTILLREETGIRGTTNGMRTDHERTRFSRVKLRSKVRGARRNENWSRTRRPLIGHVRSAYQRERRIGETEYPLQSVPVGTIVNCP